MVPPLLGVKHSRLFLLEYTGRSWAVADGMAVSHGMVVFCGLKDVNFPSGTHIIRIAGGAGGVLVKQKEEWDGNEEKQSLNRSAFSLLRRGVLPNVIIFLSKSIGSLPRMISSLKLMANNPVSSRVCR